MEQYLEYIWEIFGENIELLQFPGIFTTKMDNFECNFGTEKTRLILRQSRQEQFE